MQDETMAVYEKGEEIKNPSQFSFYPLIALK